MRRFAQNQQVKVYSAKYKQKYEDVLRRNETIFVQSNLFDFFTKHIESPSKYSPLELIHLSNILFQFSKHFLNSFFVMPTSNSVVFFLTSSMSSKCFPFMCLFILENKKSRREPSRVIGWMRHSGHTTIFGQKPPYRKGCVSRSIVVMK